MNKNICKFIPYHQDYHSIHTTNFVLETKQQTNTALRSSSTYRMHLVTGGNGLFHTLGKTTPLTKGDMFFTFPGTPYCIESVDSFTYMYISFLGSRGNMILENLKITPQVFLFHGCEEIQSFWENGLHTIDETSDLITESILLYSFYFLGNKIIPLEQKKISDQNNIFLTIKKYLDDNFSCKKITLETISRELSYSPKYISSIFKKNCKIGISEYLNTVRIQHACTLIIQGLTNVSDIANRCGYEDAQYFSKVFKIQVGISPKAYIKEVSSQPK